MLSDPKWDKKVEVELDEISQHFLRAIDYLERNGWCQCAFIDPEGRACIWGAINRTYKDGPLTAPYGSQELFGRLQKIGIVSVMAFNDNSGRTKEQVIAKLREA